MPVFTHKQFIDKKQSLPFGFITSDLITHNQNTNMELNTEECIQKPNSQLQLSLAVPRQDTMQYFMQWQRYRKYWWSSITTTPSLFTINEVNNGDETTKADIIAQFPWGHHTVETVSTCSEINQVSSQLTCSMVLENAMFTLLLDGLNSTRKEYLRLHRNMAPYKISFALETGESTNTINLHRLAKLMYHKLKSKDIAACVPDFTQSIDQQIKGNLELGVAYTAILNENTLLNGIFHLLNSNTMLKEEVHVADFDNYAALICKK